MSLLMLPSKMLGTGTLQEIDAMVAVGNVAVTDRTKEVTPTAADPITALTAAFFDAHAQMYQEVCAQAGAALDMLVRIMATGADPHAATDTANAPATS